MPHLASPTKNPMGLRPNIRGRAPKFMEEFAEEQSPFRTSGGIAGCDVESLLILAIRRAVS